MLRQPQIPSEQHFDGQGRLYEIIRAHTNPDMSVRLAEYLEQGYSYEKVKKALETIIKANSLDTDPLCAVVVKVVEDTLKGLSADLYDRLLEEYKAKKHQSNRDVALANLKKELKDAEKPGCLQFVKYMLTLGDEINYQTFKTIYEQFSSDLQGADKQKFDDLLRDLLTDEAKSNILNAHKVISDARLLKTKIDEHGDLLSDLEPLVREVSEDYSSIEDLINKAIEAVSFLSKQFREDDLPQFLKDATKIVEEINLSAIFVRDKALKAESELKDFLIEHLVRNPEALITKDKKIDSEKMGKLLDMLGVSIKVDRFTRDYGKALGPLDKLIEFAKNITELNADAIGKLEDIRSTFELLSNNKVVHEHVFKLPSVDAKKKAEIEEIEKYFENSRTNIKGIAQRIIVGIRVINVGCVIGTVMAAGAFSGAGILGGVACVLGGLLVNKLLGQIWVNTNRKELYQEIFGKGYQYIQSNIFPRVDNIEVLKDPVELRHLMDQLMRADRLILYNMFYFTTNPPGRFADKLLKALEDYTRQFDFIAGGVGANGEEEKVRVFQEAQKTELFKTYVMPVLDSEKIYSTANEGTIFNFGEEVNLVKTVAYRWATSYANTLIVARNLAYDISDEEMIERISQIKSQLELRRNLLMDSTEDRKYARWQEIMFTSFPEIEFYSRGLWATIFSVGREALQDNLRPAYLEHKEREEKNKKGKNK